MSYCYVASYVTTSGSPVIVLASSSDMGITRFMARQYVITVVDLGSARGADVLSSDHTIQYREVKIPYNTYNTIKSQ